MLARAIGCGRVIIGLTILYSPRLAARLFQLPEEQVNPSLNLVSRLTGNRELALGAMLLCAPDARQSEWLKLSAAVDAADAAVSVWGLREGLRQRAAVASALSATAYSALELVALRRLTSQDRRSRRRR
jgi:hypothetical protein